MSPVQPFAARSLVRGTLATLAAVAAAGVISGTALAQTAPAQLPGKPAISTTAPSRTTTTTTSVRHRRGYARRPLRRTATRTTSTSTSTRPSMTTTTRRVYRRPSTTATTGNAGTSTSTTMRRIGYQRRHRW